MKRRSRRACVRGTGGGAGVARVCARRGQEGGAGNVLRDESLARHLTLVACLKSSDSFPSD